MEVDPSELIQLQFMYVDLDTGYIVGDSCKTDKIEVILYPRKKINVYFVVAQTVVPATLRDEPVTSK